jgi:dienelactone hydrolase
VALLHGAHSTRSAVLDHAVVLARRGFGVLLFDARGHGRSAGRAMDFGWYGDEDVSAAVSFLSAQPDVRDGRIGVVGMSMGGEEAIGAAAADPRIRAVVAEGATNRVAADKAWLSAEFGWRGDVQRGLEWLVYGMTDLLTPADPPTPLRAAVAAAEPRPVLLVAAGERPDEGSAARFIAGGAPATVRVWEVAGATHTGALRTRPTEWDHQVTTFLATTLEATPA